MGKIKKTHPPSEMRSFSLLNCAKFPERIYTEKYFSLQVFAGDRPHITAVKTGFSVIPHNENRICRHRHINQSICFAGNI